MGDGGGEQCSNTHQLCKRTCTCSNIRMCMLDVGIALAIDEIVRKEAEHVSQGAIKRKSLSLDLAIILMVKYFCIQVTASVRCVVWWGESCVLIGCLDGKVYQWREEEGELKMVCEIGGSVIVMKWDHSKQVHVHVCEQFV